MIGTAKSCNFTVFIILKRLPMANTKSEVDKWSVFLTMKAFKVSLLV